jgi:hypothetical protein
VSIDYREKHLFERFKAPSPLNFWDRRPRCVRRLPSGLRSLDMHFYMLLSDCLHLTLLLRKLRLSLTLRRSPILKYASQRLWGPSATMVGLALMGRVGLYMFSVLLMPSPLSALCLSWLWRLPLALFVWSSPRHRHDRPRAEDVTDLASVSAI